MLFTLNQCQCLLKSLSPLKHLALHGSHGLLKDRLSQEASGSDYLLITSGESAVRSVRKIIHISDPVQNAI